MLHRNPIPLLTGDNFTSPRSVIGNLGICSSLNQLSLSCSFVRGRDRAMKSGIASEHLNKPLIHSKCLSPSVSEKAESLLGAARRGNENVC